jgi:hypothetical protein
MAEPLRSFSARALAIHFAAAFLAACGGGVYPERDPATVENVRVESARFLPSGGRFILADSVTRIGFTGIRIGYACSEILNVDLASVPAGTPPAFRPSTRVRLPASPDCAVDTAGIDTVVTHAFPGAHNAMRVRLANSTGAVTDSALLVNGTIGYVILSGVPGIAGTLSNGPWTFRDSSGLAPRRIYGDSLPSCRHLNQATFAKSKDTVTVRLSFVTLDSAAAPDACLGGVHSDSLDPIAYRP